jgi:hypothetical protein
MMGTAWLAAAFAGVMLAVAAYCTGRLAVSGARARPTERDVDAVHVAEGVAMAGMLVPRLNLVPGAWWEAVFGIAAGWFAWQALRGVPRRGMRPHRAVHYLPHLIEATAMLLMLAAVPAQVLSPPGAGMASPGGAGGTRLAGVILAVFLAGYATWTADRMTAVPSAAGPALAPRLAACCQIGVSVTMACMLITMV